MPKIIDNHKICTVCKNNVHVDGYTKNKGVSHGIASRCAECIRRIDKERYASGDTNTPDHKLKKKDCYLKRNYGINLEQFNELFERQGKRCFICRTDRVDEAKKWHVDHCHKTNRVRGILCHHCNAMLGYAKDNIRILEQGAFYLELQQIS